MKKIAVLICTLLILNLVLPVYANAEEAVQSLGNLEKIENELTYIDSFMPTDDKIQKKEYINNDTNFEINKKLFIPQTSDFGIKTIDNFGKTVTMKLPKTLDNVQGMMLEDGTVVYSNITEETSVLVQGIKESNKYGETYGVRSLIKIDNAAAPHEYEFDFELPRGYSLIKSEDYIKLLRGKNVNADLGWIGENLIYIIDEENNIIYTIDEPWAKDAIGKDVNTYYRIENNKLIQVIEFDENTIFPVIADPTYVGTLYKTETLTIKNTKKDIEKLAAMRQDINRRQNSHLSTIISHINSIFGLFNTSTGILSLIISGVIDGNERFLEKCEDAYSDVIEALATKSYSRAWIYYNYVGTYQGQNKGYVYQIRDIEYEFR